MLGLVRASPLEKLCFVSKSMKQNRVALVSFSFLISKRDICSFLKFYIFENG